MSHSLDSVNERLVQVQIKRPPVVFVEEPLLSFSSNVGQIEGLWSNQTGNKKRGRGKKIARGMSSENSVIAWFKIQPFYSYEIRICKNSFEARRLQREDLRVCIEDYIPLEKCGSKIERSCFSRNVNHVRWIVDSRNLRCLHCAKWRAFHAVYRNES